MRRLQTRLVIALGLLFSLSTFAQTQSQEFSLEMQVRAMRYFLEHTHPITGQTRDFAHNRGSGAEPEWNRVASIASTGFAYTVLAHGAERGWLKRAEVEALIYRSLQFARDHIPRRKGWFVHFYDWETGARLFDSEYSTIDTALFLAGALYAAQVFPQTPLANLAEQLYRDADFWDAMTNGGALPQKRSLTMAYVEERGYLRDQWDMYAEQMLLVLLGLGHPDRPLPREAWLAFERDLYEIPGTQQKVMGAEEALFVHQYSQAYIDFRGWSDGFPNYFDNSAMISQFHRDVARADLRYRTLREGFWGFSAGESPTGYLVYNPFRYVGTICIGCTVASAMFLPELVMGDLMAWYNGPFGSSIWGRYGFTDSVNLDEAWVSEKVIGITVGPIYMALVNMTPDISIWKTFMQNTHIQKAMKTAEKALP